MEPKTSLEAFWSEMVVIEEAANGRQKMSNPLVECLIVFAAFAASYYAVVKIFDNAWTIAVIKDPDTKQLAIVISTVGTLVVAALGAILALLAIRL